jgi:hypothetical protein
MAGMNPVQETNAPNMKGPEPGSKTPSGITSIALKGFDHHPLLHPLFCPRSGSALDIGVL